MYPFARKAVRWGPFIILGFQVQLLNTQDSVQFFGTFDYSYILEVLPIPWVRRYKSDATNMPILVHNSSS